MSRSNRYIFTLLLFVGVCAPTLAQEEISSNAEHSSAQARPALALESVLSHPDAVGLARSIEASLLQKVTRISELSDLKIEEIETSYRSLTREISDLEMRELKFATMHWRKRTVEKLIGLSANVTDAEFLEILRAVNTLSVELDANSYADLFSRYEAMLDFKPKAWAELSKQAPLVTSAQVAAGEGYRIVPTRPVETKDRGSNPTKAVDHSEIKSWAPQTLKALQEGNQIAVAPDEGVGAYRFRGRTILKPGDLLLIEQNNEFSSDLNTCVSDPVSLFSHVGIFLEIEDDGKRLPAVLEIYSHGLRIVPAELYLGRRFSHYTEIHRFKEATPEWSARLRELGNKYKSELKDWRYDFYAKEFSRADKNRERTANCSNLPSHMLIELGCDPITSRCKVAEGAQGLLRRLGLEFKEYLTPTDYRRDPRLELVGVVDALDLESVLSLELVVRNHKLKHTAAGHLTQMDWDEKKMPPFYAAKNALLTGFYAGTWGSEALLNRTTEWPWTRKNFPNAPPKVVAFITTIEPEVFKAFQSLRSEIITKPYTPEMRGELTPISEDSPRRSVGAKRIQKAIATGLNGQSTFSISSLENDPAVQEDIKVRLAPLKQWFFERE